MLNVHYIRLTILVQIITQLIDFVVIDVYLKMCFLFLQC